MYLKSNIKSVLWNFLKLLTLYLAVGQKLTEYQQKFHNSNAVELR